MRSILIPFLVICSGTIATAQTKPHPGAAVYQTYCAGCHGANMEGTTAGSALKTGKLKHGEDKASISKVITKGIEGTTMIPWENVLSAGDVGNVVDYILQVRKNNKSTSQPSTLNPEPSTLTTQHYKLNIEPLITEGIKGIWGIEFISKDEALISGNEGKLYRMVKGRLDPKPINVLPYAYATDLVGGMMDLALDPDYARNGWIYMAHSHNPKGSADKTEPGMTRFIRGKLRNQQWVEQQVLFKVDDSLLITGGTRWGSRLMFDQQGYLYFTIGDMGTSVQKGLDPQMPTRPQGKIFRIHPDGSIPKDNPLYGKADVLQAVYAWGTRNVQGLARHPQTGEIFFTDHGPQGGDELNILQRGGNYGWPLATHGLNYNGSAVSKDTSLPGMIDPITYWTPSIAVCAAEFVNSLQFPKWKNNLLVTALKFEELRRIVLDGHKVVEQEILLKGKGRVRDVKFSPDGSLYVLTNSPDAVWKLSVSEKLLP